MLNLGVNVDHVATVRQARLGFEPDPIEAAKICEEAGAWGITAHLREDRRHIIDSDMPRLIEAVKHVNMEMAVTDEMIDIALREKPHSVCLVPEKREELTTEGGLDVIAIEAKLTEACVKFKQAGIVVSLFIDPADEQIACAARIGAEYIELHTGTFANAPKGPERETETLRLIAAAELANGLGIKVNAGHGIDYDNIEDIKRIPHLHELNIGHSIIAHSIFVGIGQAVKEMSDLMSDYNL